MRTRREIHAGHTRAYTAEAARQILMPYRHGRYAAVAPGFEFKPGFIYTQVRAITARINQNFDGWPSSELKKSYRTFIGKPVFVNHQNFDPKLARGKVIAARYGENGRDKFVETVMEVDAQRFPKLAHEIKSGGMDSVSMGVEAGFTICSYCGNKAVDTPEFCAHVKFHKGEVLPRISPRTGAHEDVLVYEKCYKLGFFELSYVFDPADETAVVTRVLSANARFGQDQEPPSEMQAPDLPWADMPAAMMPTARRRRYSYGEIEAPEDVDTLRDDDDDDTNDFKHYVESPKELRGPDLDQTKRLDRAQEEEGLDADRRSESVEDVTGPATEEDRDMRTPGTLVDPRTGRRYIAADQLPPELLGGAPPDLGPGGGGLPPDLAGGGGLPPDLAGGGGLPPGGGGDLPPDVGLPPGASDDQLIQEAERDLEMAEGDGFGDEDEDDQGGYPEDEDYDEDDEPSDEDDEPFEDDDEDPFADEHDPHDQGDEDLPPWLRGDEGVAPEEGPPLEHMSRRQGNYRSSTQKKRRATKGRSMSLAQRNRVASVGRRRHYADDSGHVDGGPYHVDDNDEGVQEDVFISQVPGKDSVSAPTPGDGTISNTENNLVARIQRRSHDLKRDIIAYEQITGRRLQGSNDDADTTPDRGVDGEDYIPLPPERQYHGRRRYADSVEEPNVVNPSVQDPGGEQLTGDDFQSTDKEDVETQPHNASLRPFRAFDSWLVQTTGHTANQHNANFLRRQAARFCQASGIAVEALFPALGIVLREARRNENTQGATMRRYADEKLEVAAPQDRIDVEQPVRDTTDADAQASQFNLSDFGGNAGDNLAEPNLETDSQIWAPGENPAGNKNSARKTDGMTAVRYAEAFIAAGLAPNTAEEKWKIAGLAQTMRHGTIVDRTRLLDAINTVRRASVRRTAGARGTGNGFPQGLGRRQLTAGTYREAANDIDTDSAIFLK